MDIVLKPIGIVRTEAETVPRHWTVSDVRGELVINPEYKEGLQDISKGKKIAVLFHFHKSPPFNSSMLKQTPPHKDREFGVFSICSPKRPNPLGLSVLKVTDIHDNIIEVQGIDMIDGTPVLDIKPHIECPEQCPSHHEHKGK